MRHNIFYMKRLFLLSGLMVFFAAAQGQVVDSAALHINYVPKLINSQKINSQAVITDTSQKKIKFTYYISPQKLDLDFAPVKIKAIKMNPEIQERRYRNFIKTGFGYPVTPLCEIGMHNCQSNKYSYGLNFHHFSSWAEPIGKKQKEYAYAPTSDTRVQLFFSRFFKHYTLYSSVGFNHELANLYGYSRKWVPACTDTAADYYYDKAYRDSIHNNFIHLNARIGFGSNYTVEDRRVKEKVELNYDFIRTSHKDMEHGLGLHSFIAYDARFLKISGYQHYRLDFNVDYYRNAWNDFVTNSTDNTLEKRLDDVFKVEFRPTMNFSIKEYHLQIGVGVPIINSQNRIRCPVYPVAELQMGIVPGLLSLYVGVNGESKYNSLKNLLYENPYLKPQLDSIRFTRTQFSIYGGVKGNLVKKLNYHVSAQYLWSKDMPFFMLDTASLLKNQFDVAYGDVNLLNVCANIGWEAVNHLYLSLTGNYWGYYSLKNVDLPWYKPAWEIGLEGKYVLKKKFIFDINTKMSFCRWGLEPERHDNENMEIYYTYKPIRMRPILNFGCSFEYLITGQLSIFAQVNNIGCQYASTYCNFNNFGINVLAGVSYSFGNESLKLQKKKKP